MLVTNYFFLALGLLVTLVAALPTPFDNSVDLLVARTRTAAKKQQTEFKKIKKQLDQRLSPPRDKAVFWSGRVGSESAKDHAAKYGKKTGKQTLEMAVKKAGIKMPAFNEPNGGLWKHASKLWAERSKGKTTAILGDMRPQNTYNKIEKPALAKNKKVTTHTEHHITPKGNAQSGTTGKKGKPQSKKISHGNHHKSAQRASKLQTKNNHKAPKVAKATPKKSSASSNGGAKSKASKRRL